MSDFAQFLITLLTQDEGISLDAWDSALKFIHNQDWTTNLASVISSVDIVDGRVFLPLSATMDY